MAELKLVDADIEKYKYNGIHFHLHGLYIFTKEQLMALLEKQNTRTPKRKRCEEVKHGEWVYKPSSDELGGTDATYDWMCSVCKDTSVDNTDFCPNCGAKMDGGKI